MCPLRDKRVSGLGDANFKMAEQGDLACDHQDMLVEQGNVVNPRNYIWEHPVEK